MALMVWPCGVLIARDRLWSPSNGAARDGGRTLGGIRRTTTWQAGGAWRATLSGIWIRTREQILAAQAMDALLDGGATKIAVGRCPGRTAPVLGAYVPFSDGAIFRDGAAFESGGPNGVLVSGADKFATALTFDWSGPPLLGGEDFSVETTEGPRLHRIARFDSITVTPTGHRYVAELRPPLRAPVSAGDQMNFARPHCLMQLDNAGSFAAMLEINRTGRFDAEFVEA